MGGDDSQKLLPWRGIYSPPGRSKRPAQLKSTLYRKTCLHETLVLILLVPVRGQRRCD